MSIDIDLSGLVELCPDLEFLKELMENSEEVIAVFYIGYSEISR